MRKIILRNIFAVIVLTSATVFAGPPFNTDDPEPIDFMHWEFYTASSMHFEKYDVDATLPHFELNYGLVPNVQVHLVAPLGYVKTESGRHYGYMDTELGLKYRFINEDNGLQAGVFPLVELPTGEKEKQLGNGKLQAFLPVWIQKSWGKFTTYGGAGFWYNPGQGNKNWVFAGWECQYDFSKTVTLGAELYYHTADTKDGPADAGFNVGGYINFSKQNHILFAVGHSLKVENVVTGYVGYQLTI
jgi:hypothetical protein